jgi:phospholipid-translocating ATPase
MVADQILVFISQFLVFQLLLTSLRLYMLDGFYQSIICFYMPYLLFSPATFVHSNGLNINDRTRMGVLVASCAVIASNTYILMNTYRWDWLTVLINVISSLLIFFWTGIYSSTTASAQFYKAAAEVYGALSFWVVLLMTVIICLLPRFTVKAVQKVFFPRDVDIIREQVTQGKFKYLDQYEAFVPPKAAATSGGLSNGSAASSDLGKPIQSSMKQDPFSDDQQIYPPSVAPTIHTHNPRSQNGSNGTNYSFDTTQHPRPQSVQSAQRTRHSFDRARPSYDVNSDFNSGAMLSRVDSATGIPVPQSPHSPLKSPHDPPSYQV